MEPHKHLKQIRAAMFNLAVGIVEGRIPKNEIEFRSRVLNQQIVYWEGRMKEAETNERRQFLCMAADSEGCTPWASHIGTFSGALAKARRMLSEWKPKFRNGDGSKVTVKDMVTRREFTFTI